MKKFSIKTNLVSAILAGCMIGIGCTAYLSCDNRYIGAFIFTVGLCTICTFGMSLYTGMISYASNLHDYAKMVVIRCGNLIGAVFVGMMMSYAKPEIHELSVLLSNAKLGQDAYKTAILSIMCGMLMYAAVCPFRSMRGVTRYIGVFICIPTFILCGFEHSIADMFYFSAGFCETTNILRCVGYIVLVTLGNSIGAITFRVAHDFMYKAYPPEPTKK